MMIQISSNGSRLDQPRTLEILTRRRPYRLTLSLYGATEESYDGMTRRRGAFKRFMRGLAAKHEAGLAMRINCVVSRWNVHERDAMKAIADRYAIPSFEYTSITPTIHGTGEVLPSQAREVLKRHTPYTGCNAGITHFHADPREGQHLQGRPGPPGRPDGRRHGRAPEAGRHRRQAHHPSRRVRRVHPPEDVRDLPARQWPAVPGPGREVNRL